AARIDIEGNTAAMAHGPFDKGNLGQQAAQSACASPTRARQDTQSGGNRKSSTAPKALRARAMDPVSETTFMRLSYGQMRSTPTAIFDRALYRERRKKAERRNDCDVFLAVEAAEQIALRLRAVNRQFEKALYLNSREQGFAD